MNNGRSAEGDCEAAILPLDCADVPVCERQARDLDHRHRDCLVAGRWIRGNLGRSSIVASFASGTLQADLCRSWPAFANRAVPLIKVEPANQKLSSKNAEGQGIALALLNGGQPQGWALLFLLRGLVYP